MLYDQYRIMSERDNLGDMKPEDLSLELFSLQLELNQVPYAEELPTKDIKMCTSVASPISVSSPKLESPDSGSGVHSYYDMSMYCHQEPMCIDELTVINPDLLNHSIHNNTHPKSSDEGTVIDDEMMDVIQQTIQEVTMGNNVIKTDPGEFTSSPFSVPLSICVSSSSTKSSVTVVTPTQSGGTSSNDSYKGGHSSRPCSPSSELAGRKKKLKTRHARGSNVASATLNTSFSPYASPPTPATPVSTPVNSCPSSPGVSGYQSGQSGYFDKSSRRGSGSAKSAAEESGSESKGNTSKMPRHKRPSHIRAEHKRRNKIQTGLEDIQRMVPSIMDVAHAGGRDSKAAVLGKTVDYCRQLVGETKAQRKEMERLKREIEALRQEINSQQNELPASGARVSNPPSPTLPPATVLATPGQQGVTCQQMFKDYMNSKSLSDWKFWIFGLLVRPLFESYSSSVQTTSEEDFHKSVIKWSKSNLSLIALRPAMLSFMRHLSERTSIRSHPEKLKEEVIQKVMTENFGSPTPKGQGTLS